MNENNRFLNGESIIDETEKPVYTSQFLMTKNLFYDFCSVNFHKLKIMFLVFLGFVGLFTFILLH